MLPRRATPMPAASLTRARASPRCHSHILEAGCRLAAAALCHTLVECCTHSLVILHFMPGSAMPLMVEPSREAE